jgi:vanillate monooxygenase ferredoxin subunit
MLQRRLNLKVVDKRREAEDIYSFILADPTGKPLPPFSAGSHIDVQIDSQVTRQYSLANSCVDSDRYLIGVLRDLGGRGGSRKLCDAVEKGHCLEVSEPRNHFHLANEAAQSVLLAGGIGITPLICMAESLALLGVEFELHYCARSHNRIAFADRLITSSYSERVAFHVDDGASDQLLDAPRVVGKPDAGKHLYVCGPAAFIRWIVATAKSMDWHNDNIHLESFSGEPPELDVNADSFQVKIASTGKLYWVPPEKTVVQVLEEVGIHIPVTCGQGVCGTCLTRVVEGEPEHRDLVLTASEKNRNDQFTPCCSRSISKVLTLDI